VVGVGAARQERQRGWFLECDEEFWLDVWLVASTIGIVEHDFACSGVWGMVRADRLGRGRRRVDSGGSSGLPVVVRAFW